MDAGATWVAIGTVVFSALWTSGGQAALQRRAIQHEPDMADDLDDPALKKAMRWDAERHDYLARRQPSGARNLGCQ